MLEGKCREIDFTRNWQTYLVVKERIRGNPLISNKSKEYNNFHGILLPKIWFYEIKNLRIM